MKKNLHFKALCNIFNKIRKEDIMAKKIKINEYLEGEYYNPYCETCGTCGYIGCCGIRNFIDEHIKGKTNCKNEDIIINELIDLCEYKDEVFEENKKLKEDKKKVREFIEEWCIINPTTGKCVCYLDKNRCTELYKILGDKE